MAQAHGACSSVGLDIQVYAALVIDALNLHNVLVRRGLQHPMVDKIIWARGQHLGEEVHHHWKAALHNEGCIILQRGLGYFVEAGPWRS